MGQLCLTTAKYVAITPINLQNQLAYAWEALNRAFFILIVMFVFVQLWTAVYTTQGVTDHSGAARLARAVGSGAGDCARFLYLTT